MSLNVFSRRIPSTYQELRYLGVNSGEPYIDLGITGNQKTKAEVTFSSVETVATCLFGYQANAVGITFNLSEKSNNTRFGAWAKVGFGFELFDGQKHVVEISQQGLYQDGTLVATPTNQTFTTGNLTLFKADGAVTYGNKTIYGCRVWNNGTLQRDMVPCKRLSDNTLGMYDLVSEQFFTNTASNSSFSAGPESIGQIEKLQATILEPIFPPEYEQLEYLQSSGTQYIDTNVKLTSDDIVKCKFEITASTSSMADAIYGCHSAGIFFVLLIRNPIQARVGTSSNQVSSTNYELNTIYDTSLTNGTYIENGTTYTFTPHTGFTNLPSCYVMARNQDASMPVSAKVYSFEIVNKFNGIPCRRKSDNVLGFYDTISKTFFTNAGTGTFTAGPSVYVPNEYREVEYIECDGNQYINTGLNGKYGYKLVGSASYANGNNKNLAGIQLNGGSYRSFGPWAASQSLTLFSLGIGAGGAVNTGKTYLLNTKYDLEANISATNPYLKVNGSNATFTESPGGALSNKLADGDIYLFALNNNGSVATNFIGRVYGHIFFYINDVLQREFVPCYRVSDGVVGLYDKVNGVFYTNLGTGTFGKGPAITMYKVTKLRLNVLKSPRLPEAYEQVQYIKSDGTGQYIDLGIKPNSSTKVEMDAFCSDSLLKGLFGSQNDTTAMYLFLKNNTGYQRISARFSSSSISDNTTTFTDFINVKFSKAGCFVNDTSIGTFSTQTITGTTYNLYLFTVNNSGTPDSRYFVGKIKSFRLWDNRVLLKSLIPCYRKSDNVVGMYDIISGVFYTNQGTGSFTAGPIVNLPSDYQKVEYIEGDGNQYIDTGFKPNNKTDIDFAYSYTTTSLSSTETRIFGSRGSGNDEAFFIGLHSSYDYCWYINYGNTSNTLQDIIWGTVDTNKHTIKNKGGAFYFDGINVINFSVSTFTAPYNAIIFGANANGTIRTTKARVYYCKIYYQDDLVRDYIPCKRKSDGEIGLYDLVSKTFFTNQGTGDFIPGPLSNNMIRI